MHPLFVAELGSLFGRAIIAMVFKGSRKKIDLPIIASKIITHRFPSGMKFIKMQEMPATTM